MAKIELTGCECERCGHIWVPRNKNSTPKRCPACNSYSWQNPPEQQRVDVTRDISPTMFHRSDGFATVDLWHKGDVIVEFGVDKLWVHSDYEIEGTGPIDSNFFRIYKKG